MKALTVHQPWGWAIAAGLKRVENRRWRTRHRGPLAIHAGMRRCPATLVLPDGTPVDDPAIVYGAVVAVADLVDCVPVADAPPGPFAEGPWCWLLENVRAVEPVPAVGRQLLWDLPDDWLTRGRTPWPRPV